MALNALAIAAEVVKMRKPSKFHSPGDLRPEHHGNTGFSEAMRFIIISSSADLVKSRSR